MLELATRPARLRHCAAARFAAEARRAACCALRCRTCQALLALGYANLAGGLAFGAGELTAATPVALDVLIAHFGPFPWAVAVVGSGAVMAARRGGDAPDLAAKATGLAGFSLAALVVAALAAIGYQLLRGHFDLRLPLYAADLALNVGWNTVLLAALAVAAQAAIGRKWLAMLATAVVCAGGNLVFDHDLLRFGAPVSPWSDMNGYGHALGRHVTLGLHWTGLCAALLVAASLREAPLTPNALAALWCGVVLWLATGGWLLHSAAPAHDGSAAPAPAVAAQPAYSRLDLRLDIRPEARRLRSRGTAILTNRRTVPIADIRFVVPAGLVVDALSLTGEPLPGFEVGRLRGYRLNRPLEPGETLKVEFDLHGRPATGAGRGIRANGTFLTTADFVPTIGSFASAPPVAFRIRLGTALEQVPVAPGAVLREWQENGRRYVEYATPRPIPPLATIHSGRYAVTRDECHGRPVAFHHHPGHAAAALLAHACARMQPHAGDARTPFRVVEVPDYQPLFRLPTALGILPRPDDPAARSSRQPALAGVLPFPERAAYSLPARRLPVLHPGP